MPVDSPYKESFVREIIKWGKLNIAEYPWRKTNNTRHALVAEIMLQRTNADQVLPVYLTFTKKYRDPAEYLTDNNPMNPFITLGLQWRFKQFLDLNQVLDEMGKIPTDRAILMKLPCIGDYISGAMRYLHMGKRDYVIDSNVVRIYGRFFGFEYDGETRRKKWLKYFTDELTPKNDYQAYNYGIIDYTRRICARTPLCEMCVLNNKCNFIRKRR